MWQKMLQVGSGGTPTTKEFVLFDSTNGFASGYSLASIKAIGSVLSQIDTNGLLEIYTTTSSSADQWGYIEVTLKSQFSTLHFAEQNLNYTKVGYKTTTPTSSSYYDSVIDLQPNVGINKDDISFDISSVSGKIYICFACGKNQWGDYKLDFPKIWFD